MPYAANYKRRTPAQVASLCAQAAAIPATWRNDRPRLAPRTTAPETEAPRRRPGKRPNLYAVGYEESRNREGIG